MACPKNLRTQLMTGAEAGGTWTYDGFSVDEAGPFTIGAWDPSPLTGDDPAVDFTGATSDGYHAFTYSGVDCLGNTVNAQLIVWVSPRPDAGDPAVVDICEDETITVDLFAELGGTPQTGGVWELTSGTIDPGSTFDAGAGTVDFVNHPPGTLIFTYTVSPSAPAGYSLQNCENCDDDASTVSVNINDTFDPGTPIQVGVCA